LGSWHVISVNTTCGQIGGCGTGSPEEKWLRADLAAHPVASTLAVLHDPRFSSGSVHGSSPAMQPFWQALYDYGAELVLSGNDHEYERFAPQTPGGASDPTRGIRQWVVGTGGRSHYTFGAIQPNSQVRNNDTFGILELTLHATSYDWRFVPEAGKTFTDVGNTSCH
jgi:acid phosphatase type 7